MRFVFIVLMLAIALSVIGCGHKKIVAKNCDKAGNAEIYVCDPF